MKTSKKTNTVTVAISQMACLEDPAANRRKQAELIDQAGKEGAQIFCTQELFTSQYFCQSEEHRFFKLAETIPGPSTDLLGKIAKRHGMVIIASLFEKRAAGLYHNTAAIIAADGNVMGIYRKMHIPDDPLYYEKFYFTPGDAGPDGGTGGFKAWQTPWCKIGTLICWDQWYPEGARLTALQGAEILFYPTAIGWHPKERQLYGTAQHESWEIIQRSHAVANGCYVCAPNRIGIEKIRTETGGYVSDDGIQFWGQSFIAEPSGQLLAKAGVEKQQVIIETLDLDKVEFARTHWPFLRDRRIDAYGDITKRYTGT